MFRFLRMALVLASVPAMTSVGIAPVASQTGFPVKPVRIVLPIPAGSALDVVTRVLAEQLTSRWGQQVVVENRPGGGGAIAAQAVATAQPDGYTLLGGAGSIFTILPAQREKISIDVNRAFTQVGMIVGRGLMYIAVPPSLGVASFPELVALAKSKPGKVLVGTNGAGTLPHFAALALMRKGGIPITVIPYNQGGTQAAITDIMGGRVHATIEAIFGLLGPLQSGDLKLIGVMSPERDPDHPDLPTVAETVPGLTAVGFMSLAAPAGTPPDVVQRLSEGLTRVLGTPRVKQRFAELGIPAKIMTPAETKAFVENEERLWWPMVRELEPQ